LTLDEATATVLGGAAHIQIQSRLAGRGIVPELPIPRAAKAASFGELRCQPLGQSFGYADLARLEPSVGISEIKPYWMANALLPARRCVIRFG